MCCPQKNYEKISTVTDEVCKSDFDYYNFANEKLISHGKKHWCLNIKVLP